MNKTIFRSVLLACCIIMVFSLVFTLFFLNSYFMNIEFTNLRGQAEHIAAAVDKLGLEYFNSFRDEGFLTPSVRKPFIRLSGFLTALSCVLP